MALSLYPTDIPFEIPATPSPAGEAPVREKPGLPIDQIPQAHREPAMPYGKFLDPSEALSIVLQRDESKERGHPLFKETTDEYRRISNDPRITILRNIQHIEEARSKIKSLTTPSHTDVVTNMMLIHGGWIEASRTIVDLKKELPALKKQHPNLEKFVTQAIASLKETRAYLIEVKAIDEHGKPTGLYTLLTYEGPGDFDFYK